VGCIIVRAASQRWAAAPRGAGRAARAAELAARAWLRVGAVQGRWQGLLLECGSAGHLVVLQCARADGCPWNKYTCVAAARAGHLHVLKWARANGCPWNEYTCMYAAGGGHLAVLRWARANGCPWDVWACKNAAEGGHLAVLQWLRANGCPWDECTCAYAAGGGHLAVLQLLHANGCPVHVCCCSKGWAPTGCAAVAACHGCPWDSMVCTHAVRQGHAAVLHWTCANGCRGYSPGEDG
jgi:hypothetical protein